MKGTNMNHELAVDANQERFERCLIGPEEAIELLAGNTENRPLNQRLVNRFAQVMTDGRWQFNPGDAIVIDRDGKLRNGQHRLNALIQSETHQPFLVTSNAMPDAFRVLDNGRPRGGADVLSIRGEHHVNVLSAALAWIVHEKRAYTACLTGSPYRLDFQAVDNDTILKTLDEHPVLRESISASFMIDPKRLLAHSLVIWLHYRFALVDSEKAEAFWRRVGSGEGIVEGDPEFALRNWLLRTLLSQRKPMREQTAAVIIKAWNSRYRGQTRRVCHWDGMKEGFPFVEGEARERPKK